MDAKINPELNKIKMPYTTPEGFFDEFEDRIWKEVKGDFTANESAANRVGTAGTAKTAEPAKPAKPARRRTSHFRLVIGTVSAIAASFALVFFLHTKSVQQDNYTISDVDQAFSQLSADDQAFMLSVYEQDVFINE